MKPRAMSEWIVPAASSADWPSRSLYHLMINTSMGDERVIGTILDTMHALEARPSEHQMSGIR